VNESKREILKSKNSYRDYLYGQNDTVLESLTRAQHFETFHGPFLRIVELSTARRALL